MTSITEDPSLPLDLNGTSHQIANSTLTHDNGDTTDQDNTTSQSSEIEHPGTFRNLTSTGKESPHRTRTMKDQEIQLGEYKAENFGLKLRIYHLEEALRKKYGGNDDGWKMDIELQVQLDNLKKELQEKTMLLMKAKTAIDQITAQHDAQLRDLQRKADAGVDPHQMEELKRSLAEREDDLDQAMREAQDNREKLQDMQDLNDGLNRELRDKDRQLGQMERDLDELQRALEERNVSTDSPLTLNRGAQTVEPLPAMLAQANEALEAAQAELEQEQAEAAGLRAKMADKDRKVKQLEMELLGASQKLAAGADDHARELQDQSEDLDSCRRRIRELEKDIRDKESEVRRAKADRDGALQQAGEAERMVQKLQPLIQDRDREIELLQQQCQENENLKQKLRNAETRAREAQPSLDDKQRELERMGKELRDKEEEMNRLRDKLRQTEEALSHARKSAHMAGMDNREQNEALRKLKEELEALRAQINKQREGAQADLLAALAAKEAAMQQMKRELEDLRSQLDQAQQTILHLTTSKAAELGVLRATIDDLTRQLEHLEKQNSDLRAEVARLTGEKASLERELNKLRNENRALRNQLAALENELGESKRNLAHAEETIAELEKLIEELQRRGSEESGASEAELDHLRSQLGSLDRALRNKQSEVDSLKASLSLKDRQIAELQEQLDRLNREKADLLERISQLQGEKIRLEAELAQLRSQGRISKLASDDIQVKLTQVFAEREELARKLQQAQDSLRDKEAANINVQGMCDALREQLAQLQRQVEELSQRPPHTVTMTTHESTTTHEAPDTGHKASPEAKGASSTTMIFGSNNDSLLLTILKKLHELDAEISAGRADSHSASSSLSSKLEHLTQLQQQLEGSLKDRGSGDPSNYTAYYFTGRDEEDSEQDHHRSSTPQGTPPADLRAEVDELKHLNSELQSRLNDSATRPPVNYSQLEGEVDRLLAELDAEKERSEQHKAQQERELNELQQQLRNTEAKVRDLEQQLRQAMLREASAAKEQKTAEALQAEVDRLVREVDESRGTIAALRGRLDAEKNETRTLRSELSTHTTPQKTSSEAQASSSMPDLFTAKAMSDSWTSPGVAGRSMSEAPDVRELKRKHDEVTRLNLELQRKCQEQLHRSPTSSRPGSGSQTTSQWQSRLREQEERLRKEMLERERELLAQIRDSEARLVDKETELRVVETETSRDSRELRAGIKSRDEEIINLKIALSASEDKVRALEEQLEQLLTLKNSTIADLQGQLRDLREQLSRARGSSGAEGDEVTTLTTTVETLTEQLGSRIEDNEELERRIQSLEEQKAVLNSQLASAQEQILLLKEELTVYQKLLDERKSSTTGDDNTERIIELLEEIRRLREQLDQSIRSNHALNEQLQSRLEQSRSETSIRYTSSTHNSPRSRARSAQTTPPKRTSHSTSTSPRVRTSSTNTRAHTSDKASGKTRVTLHYDSESSLPQSHSEFKLSDTSTSSISQQHRSGFTPPKDTSTPHTSTPHSTRHSYTRHSSTPHSSTRHTGTNTDGREQSSTTSRYTHTKTTTTSRKGSSDLPDLGGVKRSTAGPGPTKTTSFSWVGTGDFDSLETRLQQALNSPSLPAADRSFLEDLLHYLRQQRRQLDDSRKLLEKLEQSSGIPSTSHIHVETAQSGTLPTFSHTHTSPHSPHPHSSHPPSSHPHSSQSGTQTESRSTRTSTQTTPLRSSHTTSRYTVRSETSTGPGGLRNGATGHGNGTTGHGNGDSGLGNGTTELLNGEARVDSGVNETDAGEPYTYAGPPREAAVNGDVGRTAKVDLSKIYEQLLQTHSSLAEARSALNHRKKQ